MAGLLLACAQEAGADVGDMDAWDARHWGLPSVTQSIAQTSDGYLHLASLNGLFRFDGVHFTPIALPAPTRAVRVLLTTRLGELWVAAGGGFADLPLPGEAGGYHVTFREGRGGLYVVGDGGATEVLPADGTAAHWVWSLAELGDGRVLAGTEAGLSVISRETNGTHTIEAVPWRFAELVVALAVGPNGVAWLGTASGVWRWDGGGEPKLEPGAPVRALATGPDGTLWVARETVLEAWRDDRLLRAVRGGEGTLMRHVLVTNEAPERPYVGTSVGLFRVEGDELVRVTERLPRQSTRALFRDREGSLWAGVKGLGVAQLRPAAVINVGRPEGLPGDATLSFAPASPNGRNGYVVVTSAGVVKWSPGRTSELAVTAPLALPRWMLRNLAVAPDGAVWIGWDALVRLPDTALDPHKLGGHVRAMTFDRGGDLLVGWHEGGLTRYAGGDPRRPSIKLGGLCAGAVASVTEGASGTLWLVGAGGLARVRPGEGRGHCVLPTAEAERGALRLTSAFEVAPDTVWATAVGPSGLLRVRGDEVRIAPTSMAVGERGFPGTSLHGVVGDGRGNLWFSSNRGVFRARIADLDAVIEGRTRSVQLHHVDADAGMRSPDCQATFTPVIQPWRDGGVAVATALGLAFIAPPEAQPRPRATPVIEGLVVDGAPRRRTGGDVRLGPDARSLEIRFSAPTFLAPQLVTFEHRLDGVDRDWVPVGDARVARYGKLPAGQYRFRVRVDGTEGGAAEAAVAFTVLAPWWRMRPVQLGFVLTLIALAWLGHRARLGHERARFSAIEQERARIARELHDGLAQLFLGVGYQLEAVRRRLARPTPEIEGLLDDARAMVQEAQAETKRTLWSLRAGYETGALGRSLARVVEDARRRLGVDARLRVASRLPDSGILDHEVPRIVQEAITNAARHGRARAVEVATQLDGGALIVTVDDDGTGIPDEAVRGQGLGLAGMRERAARCGGTLDVAPRHPTSGTRVRLVVPAEPLAAITDRSRGTP